LAGFAVCASSTIEIEHEGAHRNMAIIRKVLAGLAVCAACTGAHSQFALSEGTFQSNQLVVRILLLGDEKGVARVGAGISQGSCSGTISGIGNIASRKLTFAPYVKEPGGESCTMTVEFDSQWRKVKVTSNGGCAPYHGASCGWEGQEAVKKK